MFDESAFTMRPDFFEDVKSYGVTPVWVAQKYTYLGSLFGGAASAYFGTSNKGDAAVLRAVHAALALERLQDVSGFSEHLKEYANNHESTYFVTAVADYFLRQGVGVELEPRIENSAKSPDIKVDGRGGRFYVECKSPTKDIVSVGLVEQIGFIKRFWVLVSLYPCSFFVSYSVLSDKILNSIEEVLLNELPGVKSDMTFDICGVEIIVYGWGVKCAGLPSGTGYCRDGVRYVSLPYNLMDGRVQVNLLSYEGSLIAFSKKNIDVSGNVKSQISNAKRKAKGFPVLLALKRDYLIGSFGVNRDMIAEMFDENNNTSLSGVILFGYAYNFKDLIRFEVDYIPNPFAKFPVKGVQELFSKDDRPLEGELISC